MSGLHYHIIAVGHKIPLENSSDQTSVLEMAYCCTLELSFGTGKPVKKKICLHLQLRAKDFSVMRGKILCSLSALGSLSLGKLLKSAISNLGDWS